MPLLGPEGREQVKIAGRYGAIGIELVLSVVVGFLGGKWLDGQLHTTPWLTWTGFLLGLVAGFKSLYVLARKTKSELDPTDADRTNSPPDR